MADIRDGNDRAFELLYRMEFNNVVHFISSYVKDRGYAEDLAQETLCSLWEKREILDPEKNIRSFVFKIARNKTLNALKEKRLFSAGSAYGEITAEIEALEAPSMDVLIDSLELGRLLDGIYDALPDSARGSFIMSRKKGMTNKEIAQASGKSVKAIEYHIRISLTIFRKMLKEYFPF